MEILTKRLEDLKPYDKNPRKNDRAVEKVVESIKLHGFIDPILITEDGEIVAGHTRYKAATQVGLEEVPCIVVDIQDPELIRQYRIIDNKTQELSAWDVTKLIAEMKSTTEVDVSAFEFADFTTLRQTSDDEEDEEDYTGNLDVGVEINLDDFDDETFEHECPYCGFRWNE